MLVPATSNPAATSGVPSPKVSNAAANSAQGRSNIPDAVAGSIADAVTGSMPGASATPASATASHSRTRRR
jgi:hypothetical protein